MKNFAITGVAGYIAPRHLQAIKDTGNHLLAAVDPHDSVGILDRYFPNASFFTEFERFDRHIEKLRRKNGGNAIDFVSICSPNNLHDAHMRFALRVGADAICEKPLVLNPWNLDALQELEQESGKRIFNILQLRVHPALIAVREQVQKPMPDVRSLQNNFASPADANLEPRPLKLGHKKHDVTLTYITSRGPWYDYSWKGDISKSGGVAMNIGVHFFDLLMWLFGNVQFSEVHLAEPHKMSGFLELKNAYIRWYLSIDRNDLPKNALEQGRTTHRSISVDGNEIEFTEGFTDLHTRVYENIFNGKGFGIDDARASIETVYAIRMAKLTENPDCPHPFLPAGKINSQF
ncbi:MAG: Gfo/Idh/MocA family oxidoreductase [Ignavibacteria bacterium]|jgi:UDP-N-acetyl-2-amino-2-deoxyglucuronate dehydrogenase|nr:Gfo/Idh/MocA family oxidoreductase [Ignavibacteria bacterium]MCU7503717.1 Gfo/Idh/MocA family oxidoreductase [Ignavibacteria bacterium]MCU7517637.1 Gfo/Idh/MocA family oxidoreductase [Ignavibacteria bacterium]